MSSIAQAIAAEARSTPVVASMPITTTTTTATKVPVPSALDTYARLKAENDALRAKQAAKAVAKPAYLAARVTPQPVAAKQVAPAGIPLPTLAIMAHAIPTSALPSLPVAMLCGMVEALLAEMAAKE